jgi:serine/threonine-protein kinase
VLVVTRRHPETGWDTWTLALDGRSGPQPHLNGPSDEHSATVSPDGHWLAYVSNESGQDEAYVRRFRTPRGPVQVSSGGGREPRWAPSGRELFYRNEQGLVAAAVSASASFRVGQRAVLFDDKPYLSHATDTAYDVHPDGRRFLMIRRGSEHPQVVVVLNWLDQLRAAAAAPGRTTEAGPRELP